MKRLDLWKLSLLNVFASPVRSLLTVLGMAIGIGAILAVITLGEAGRVQVRSEMGRLGIDKVWLTAGEEKITQGDAGVLSKRLQVSAAETVYLPVKAEHGFHEEDAVVIGCTEDYLDMTGTAVKDGRMLYPLEWGSGYSVLAGDELAKRLQVNAGEEILIQGIPFKVRGIVQSGGSFSRVEAEDALYMPLETAAKWLGEEIHEIMLDVPASKTPDATAALAQNVMKNSLGKTVEAVTMQVQMEAADSVVVTFVDVLKWVALICILVGGIGVMNILLVSVRERRREIGVMKSLGTTHRQICALFLLEALCYAMIGGILGILTGLGLVAAAGESIGLRAFVKGKDCIIVFLCALGVGLFFGVVPASGAARMSCVDALRSEP